eukprot:CAMPEP_0202956054 /NCGR_PEP_ID=MMETSP1396-20130829/607_1 /ASSEMBLY_ACC=CAM_ASM_000872 /TAXON_ID= /ORGANISM="Pseudokeronopsis sp., Strain Brazil" /LENGTH=107 /DNA_ID=CAMNT_0049672905 /DNA_START=546 /DNA_END=869 /DNA_ORIENTATION=+
MEGDVNVHSVSDDLGIIRHENLLGNYKSNIVYCVRAVRESAAESSKLLVGSQSNLMSRFDWDPKSNSLEAAGEFLGHTGAVRNIAISHDCQWVASSSEDHTVKLWDY